jgi:hypothetical protein
MPILAPGDEVCWNNPLPSAGQTVLRGEGMHADVQLEGCDWVGMFLTKGKQDDELRKVI